MTARLTAPNVTEQSREERDLFRRLERHPLLDGRLIENVLVGFDQGFSTDRPKVTTTRVSHSLGRKPRGYILVNANRGLWSVSEKSSDSQTADLHFTSDNEFIESQVVKTDTTTVTFSGLDGNLDYEYFLEGQWKSDTGVGDELYLRFNGITINHSSVFIVVDPPPAATPSFNSSEIALAVDTANAQQIHYMRVHIYAGDEGRRYVYGETVVRESAGMVAGHSMHGLWDDISTRVTSLEIFSNTATNIITNNSWFELYRKPRSATISLWVF